MWGLSSTPTLAQVCMMCDAQRVLCLSCLIDLSWLDAVFGVRYSIAKGP